jgi:segregation and condensation protein B
MTDQPLKNIIEAALFAAGKPLTIDHFLDLFAEDSSPERSAIRTVLRELQEDYAERGVELVEVSGGYRFQTKANLTPWLKHLQPERSPRYSRAVLETMAIIAYRQPITRREIESIRGISVSTDIMKRLQDYNWIRILAHRDTPGRPALYGTTRAFLDYFNLKNLSDLPPLMELRQIGEEQAKLFEAANNDINQAAVEIAPENNAPKTADGSDETEVTPKSNTPEPAVEIAPESHAPKMADGTDETEAAELAPESNTPVSSVVEVASESFATESVVEVVADSKASEVVSEIKAAKIAPESKAIIVESNVPEPEAASSEIKATEIASETKLDSVAEVIVDSITPVSSVVPETEAAELVSETNPKSKIAELVFESNPESKAAEVVSESNAFVSSVSTKINVPKIVPEIEVAEVIPKDVKRLNTSSPQSEKEDTHHTPAIEQQDIIEKQAELFKSKNNMLD